MGEFGLGIAPKDSKPVNKIELTKEKEAEIADANAYEEYAPSVATEQLDDDENLLRAAREKNKKELRPFCAK